MTKRIMRGVQNIRTLSGSVDENAIPYKAYMKLSILEMEKFRRGKEKQSAQERVRHIDQRFGDIEMERQEIIAALESGGTRRQHMPDTDKSPKVASRKTTGPFKIKY
ncbi:hypothetical protein [Desulfobacterium sp. N47]|uniref:Uncharacterized protein n=1 Tax=uncultured Desulfobacterium sp. TaxID=201089 RepID=E1YDY5_9BACT|nr:unknown protein [uncultured Desulfobacterium sp.]